MFDCANVSGHMDVFKGVVRCNRGLITHFLSRGLDGNGVGGGVEMQSYQYIL